MTALSPTTCLNQQHSPAGFGTENIGWAGQALPCVDHTAVYDNLLRQPYGMLQKPGKGHCYAKGLASRERTIKHGNPDIRRGKNYRRLWDQVRQVGRGQLLEDRRTVYDMSVEDLVRMICQLPAETSVATAVHSALQYLDSRAVAALLKELARIGRINRAIELFDWLRSLEPHDELCGLLDVWTYTTAISLAGQSQQLRRALELVAELRSRGHSCNVHTYSSLMNVCIKCGELDLSLDVYKQMRSEGLRPNVVTYNTLIDVYGKTGQWEKAVAVTDVMQEEGLEPEVRTYNTAIIACNMCGQPQEALKVYDKLLAAGMTPISTTYTALISAYGKAGQLDKALETFEQMVRTGCERSVITYSALISTCEKAGRWELALQLFDQMHKENCTPNTVTYNSLITACAQGAQWEKASDMFEQMKLQGCKPDVVTYTALIGAYERGGQWRRAIKAFEQMQQQGCKPDSIVYSTMIDLLWNTGACWALNRALGLYSTAARNWQFRFTIQRAATEDGSTEFVVPSSTLGVATLALHRWLGDMRADGGAKLLHDTASNGGNGGEAAAASEQQRQQQQGQQPQQQQPPQQQQQRDCVVLSLARGRYPREQLSHSIREALSGMLQGLGSPFVLSDPVASGDCRFHAPSSVARMWLIAPSTGAALAAFLSPAGPPGVGSGRDDSRRQRYPEQLSSEVALEMRCVEAFSAVQAFEASHHLNLQAMGPSYLQHRQAYIEEMFHLAQNLRLKDETVYDALLLMDRVMSTGLQLSESLGLLFVASVLLMTARQGEPADRLPSDAQLDAMTHFPPGSVSRMEHNVRCALKGDTSAISALRCLKLFLERIGYDMQDVYGPPFGTEGVFQLLPLAQLNAVCLNFRPSALAAAILQVDRRRQGRVPAWPNSLAALTGFCYASSAEFTAAICAVESLIGMGPPPMSPGVSTPGGNVFANNSGSTMSIPPTPTALQSPASLASSLSLGSPLSAAFSQLGGNMAMSGAATPAAGGGGGGGSSSVRNGFSGAAAAQQPLLHAATMDQVLAAALLQHSGGAGSPPSSGSSMHGPHSPSGAAAADMAMARSPAKATATITMARSAPEPLQIPQHSF